MGANAAETLSALRAAPVELSAELNQRYRELEALLAEAQEHIEPIGDEAFRWRPEPSRWSVSECLDHLNVTFDMYLPGVEKCIANGRAAHKLGDRPPRRGRFNNWFIGTLEPPVKTRVGAPKKLRPTESKPKAETYPAWLERKKQYVELLAAANGLDLWRNRLSSPVISIWRFSLGETFAVLAAHERRHLWQARQVIAAEGFPG